jgi:hypothetical protein
MRCVFLILIFFFPIILFSQNKIDRFNLLWMNYQNSLRLSKKWEILTDAQFRSKEITQSWFLFAVRSGVSYNMNNTSKIAAGFCWFGVPVANSDNLILRNEWRPWQDYSINKKLGQVDFIQRVRLEERFLTIQSVNGQLDNELVFRLRYKTDFEKFINKTHWLLKFGNEIMINPGFIGNGRFFDQNRTYAALGYKFSDQLQVNMMYMKIFQWRNAVEILEDQNVIRINFNHQLSLKK